jgi:hypothetical protein
MAKPQKLIWPIGFNELLRYAFAKKRPEARLKFYRLFLRDYLYPSTTLQASRKEIEKALRADRKKKFDEDRAFHLRMWSGGSFEKWKQENIKNRMTKMADASCSKEARIKRMKKGRGSHLTGVSPHIFVSSILKPDSSKE